MYSIHIHVHVHYIHILYMYTQSPHTKWFWMWLYMCTYMYSTSLARKMCFLRKASSFHSTKHATRDPAVNCVLIIRFERCPVHKELHWTHLLPEVWGWCQLTPRSFHQDSSSASPGQRGTLWPCRNRRAQSENSSRAVAVNIHVHVHTCIIMYCNSHISPSL